MTIAKYKKAFSKESVGRYDVTAIFAQPELYDELIDDLIRPFAGLDFDKVVCLDAVGFILGGSIGTKLKKGIVPARKAGKLPLAANVLSSRSFVDYSRSAKGLEINRQLINPGDRVLLVDDWVETGAQMRAVIDILEELEAEISGIACIGADDNVHTAELFRRYNLQPIGVDV